MGRTATLTLAAIVGLSAAGGCTGDDGNAAADVDMVALHDVVEAQARDSIAVALYENPGSRADLLADVPIDEPDLWA